MHIDQLQKMEAEESVGLDVDVNCSITCTWTCPWTRIFTVQ